ncbi:hypothetical protein [Kitasatospora sp. NPDC098663]|uniref:hypothetical protein n=1 Tax=Kitasatospora sp. NPDC098663 TaxID=3364096 RepID=UPI0038282646
MPSNSPVYSMALGQLIAANTPLGPLYENPITCFTPASGTGKLHGEQTCGALRSAASVHEVTTALHDATPRLCANCRWPLPADSPLVGFVDAVRTIRRLESYIGPEPSPDTDFDEAEEQDAAAALATGEYPKERAGTPDDEEKETEEDADDKEWERFKHARLIRERHRGHWRYLHGYMIESAEAVAAHPWLRSFAEPLQHALAVEIERERHALARLLRPQALLDTAAIRALPSPELNVGPEFAILGSDADQTLRRAWSEWQDSAATSWKALEDDHFAAYFVLHDAMKRRRKGRDEAVTALERLTAEWIGAARVVVAHHGRSPRRMVAVKLPTLHYDPYSAESRDPLTDWEAGIIATYQIAANWDTAAVALLLPSLVAEHLISDAGSLMPTAYLDAEESGLSVSVLLANWRPDETGRP